MDMFLAILERDIDLMLVEELACSHSFAAWILAQCSMADQSSITIHSSEAKHSVGGSGVGAGETDVWAKIHGQVGANSFHALLLIENKISATFTPNQPIRYRQRLPVESKAAGCDRGVTILVAPKGYIKSCDPNLFDVLISYEDIQTFFEVHAAQTSDAEGRRLRHKAMMVRHGIEQHRRSGGQGIIFSSINTDFFDRCYAVIRSEFPGVTPHPNKKRGNSSNQITFHFDGDEDLRESVKSAFGMKPKFQPIVWLLFPGRVSVLFQDWPKKLVQHLRRKFQKVSLPSSDSSIRITPSSQSIELVLYPNLPAIDSTAPFESQIGHLRNYLAKVINAKAWIEGNVSQIKAWIHEICEESRL